MPATPEGPSVVIADYTVNGYKLRFVGARYIVPDFQRRK
jgi:hypothetical protein